MGAIGGLVDEYIIYPVLDTVGDILGEIPIIGPIIEDVQEFATHEVYGSAREILDSVNEMIPDDLKMAAATVAAIAIPPLWFLPAVVAAANAADQAEEAGASDGEILGAAAKAGAVTLAVSYAGGAAGDYAGSAVTTQTGSQLAGKVAAGVVTGSVTGASRAAIYGQDIKKAAIYGAAMGAAGVGIDATFDVVKAEFNAILTPEDISSFNSVEFGDGVSGESISTDIRGAISDVSTAYSALPDVVQDILGSTVESTIITSIRAGEFELADMKQVAVGAIARAAATSDTFKEVVNSSDLDLSKTQQAQLTEVLYTGAVTAATGGDPIRAMGRVGLKISARAARKIMTGLTDPELIKSTEELSGVTKKGDKLVGDVNATADRVNDLSEKITTAATTINDKQGSYVSVVEKYRLLLEAGEENTEAAKELEIEIKTEEAWFAGPEYKKLSAQLELDLAAQGTARVDYTALMSEFTDLQNSLDTATFAYEGQWGAAKEAASVIVDRSVVSSAIDTVVENPKSVPSEVSTAFIAFATSVGGVTKDFGNEDLSLEDVALAQDTFTSSAAQTWIADDPETMEAWGHFLKTPSSDAAVYFGNENLSQDDISQYINSNTVTRKEVAEQFAAAGVPDLNTYEQEWAAYKKSLGGAAYDPSATNQLSREDDWKLGDPNRPGSFVYNDNRARAANRDLNPSNTPLEVLIGGRPQDETFKLIEQYADPLVTTGPEVQEFFDVHGYVPTQTDLDQFTAQISEATQRNAVNAFVAQRQYTEVDAAKDLELQGIYNPTAEELSKFVAQSSDPTFRATQAKAAADYWNPLGVSEDEVRQVFVDDFGYEDFSPEDIDRFTGRVGDQSELSDRIGKAIPGMTTAAVRRMLTNGNPSMPLQGRVSGANILPVSGTRRLPQQQQQLQKQQQLQQLATTSDETDVNRPYYIFDPYGESIFPNTDPTTTTTTAAGGGLIEDKTDEILRALRGN